MPATIPQARPVVAPIGPLPARQARGSEVPPERFPAASSIRIDRPARPDVAPEAVAAAPVAAASAERQYPIITVHNWSAVGLRPEMSSGRLGWGWWVALAGAAAFFTVTAALWFG